MGLVEYLQEQLTVGQRVSPSEIRNMINAYSGHEAISGDEVFWLIYEGHLSDFPHVWKG